MIEYFQKITPLALKQRNDLVNDSGGDGHRGKLQTLELLDEFWGLCAYNCFQKAGAKASTSRYDPARVRWYFLTIFTRSFRNASPALTDQGTHFER